MHLFSHRVAKPQKTCAVLRYGGLGDALQAISILPWLKDEGYHITMYTVPSAWEVIKHDPHIDEVVLQDVDDIPNHELGEFWAYTAKKYDRFINLSESVERTLLAMPGTTNHGWSHAMRAKYLDVNYMQFVHDIAGVPFPAHVKFYPTQAEWEWALKEIERIGGRPIMWVLSGSAVHKVWPHLDEVIAAVLRADPTYQFVLVGDADTKMLQQGLEEIEQVHCKAGEYSIRETMALARVCDLVIGPETGVMNAIAYEHVPNKIVILSHSTIQNLTRDWVNTTSLHAKHTPCYPCHQIHFDFKHCKEVEGIAACQRDISAETMITAILEDTR